MLVALCHFLVPRHRTAQYPQGNWNEDVVYIRQGWEYDDDDTAAADQSEQRKAA
jgi:hypothetical protein